VQKTTKKPLYKPPTQARVCFIDGNGYIGGKKGKPKPYIRALIKDLHVIGTGNGGNAFAA
jgi:hypothetical protein